MPILPLSTGVRAPIAREEKWAIEIDPIPQTSRARERERFPMNAHHAADQQFEAALARVLAQVKRLRQSACFVEVHVDGFVAICQARKTAHRVATFIRTDTAIG